MKKIRFQAYVGKYNWANENEVSCQMTATISDENGVVKRGDHECRLRISSTNDGDPDGMLDWLNSAWGNGEIETLIELAAKDAHRWIGSIDYKSQCLAFTAEYKESHEELEKAYVEERGENLRKRIESLQRELKSLGFSTDGETAVAVAKKHILESDTSPKRMAEWSRSKLSDLKPESESFIKGEEKAKKYDEQHAAYEAILAPTPN